MQGTYLYEYLAKANPIGARGVISRFGYSSNPNVRKPLPGLLEELVAYEGEPALKELAAIHPDKELILELFGAKECDCDKKLTTKFENFLNATGNNNQSVAAQAMMMQQPMRTDNTIGICVFAGALVMAAAIIAKSH